MLVCARGDTDRGQREKRLGLAMTRARAFETGGGARATAPWLFRRRARGSGWGAAETRASVLVLTELVALEGVFRGIGGDLLGGLVWGDGDLGHLCCVYGGEREREAGAGLVCWWVAGGRDVGCCWLGRLRGRRGVGQLSLFIE